MDWYYIDENENETDRRKGPLDYSQINYLIEIGEISSKTLLWNEDLSDWNNFESLKEKYFSLVKTPALELNKNQSMSSVVKDDTTTNVESHTKEMMKYDIYDSKNTNIKSETTFEHEQYAYFGTRFLALLLDSLVIQLISIAIYTLFGFSIQEQIAIYLNQSNMTEALVQPALIMGIINMIYYCWMVYRFGGSLGKLLFDIRITRSDGSRLTFARAVARYLAVMLSTLTLFLGYLFALGTPKKQALHDLLCDTIVVKKESDDLFE